MCWWNQFICLETERDGCPGTERGRRTRLIQKIDESVKKTKIPDESCSCKTERGRYSETEGRRRSETRRGIGWKENWRNRSASVRGRGDNKWESINRNRSETRKRNSIKPEEKITQQISRNGWSHPIATKGGGNYRTKVQRGLRSKRSGWRAFVRSENSTTTRRRWRCSRNGNWNKSTTRRGEEATSNIKTNFVRQVAR